jgi:lysophospholipase L1-like esterase
MVRRAPALILRAFALAVLLQAGACSGQVEAEPPARAASTACASIPAGAFEPPKDKVASHTSFAHKHFRKRLREFSRAPLACGQIIMLGDSLTELNDWTRSVRAGVTLQNRGISGDTSDGVLARLEEITASQPKAVFLMIGTNDLWSSNPPETTAANISKITDRIKARNPGTIIFVQTVLPMRVDYAPNDKARAINALLKKDSKRAPYILLDTYLRLADSKGALRGMFTTDGIHLNDKGYAVWSNLVTDTLRQHDLSESAPAAD